MARATVAAGPGAGPAPMRVEMIALGQLDPDPINPRQGVLDLTDLLASLPLIGVLQPLRVRPDPERPGRYTVGAGNRRLLAAQQLQAHPDRAVRERLQALPCIVCDQDPAAAYRDALADNVVRVQLTRRETMRAALHLHRALGLTVREVAAALGRSHGDVGELIQVAKAEDLVALVDDSAISLSTAGLLVRLDGATYAAALEAARGGAIRTAGQFRAWRSARAGGAAGPGGEDTGDPGPEHGPREGGTPEAGDMAEAGGTVEGHLVGEDVVADQVAAGGDAVVDDAGPHPDAAGRQGGAGGRGARTTVRRETLQVFAVISAKASLNIAEVIAAMEADLAALRS